MSDRHLTIGELAKRTGVATSALRYYEELGLIPAPVRVSGQRRYPESAVGLVGMILLLRDVGFSLRESKAFLASRTQAVDGWRRLTQRKLAARLSTSGRRPIRPATIAGALEELHAAGLAMVDVDDQDVTANRWSAVPATRDPLLKAVDLHGPHDLRHTFETWLEDAGIPARVIDELMGHEATGRSGQQRGSATGTHYRHTTPEMAARVIEAIER
jgi:DNA-binding transcriptional MerR regulator